MRLCIKSPLIACPIFTKSTQFISALGSNLAKDFRLKEVWARRSKGIGSLKWNAFFLIYIPPPLFKSTFLLKNFSLNCHNVCFSKTLNNAPVYLSTKTAQLEPLQRICSTYFHGTLVMPEVCKCSWSCLWICISLVGCFWFWWGFWNIVL